MLNYKIEHTASSSTLKLKGMINEATVDVFAQLEKENYFNTLTIDLDEVTSINSIGIRIWSNFIRTISNGREVSLAKCSMDFAQQFCLLPNLRQGIKIDSFYISFYCEQCSEEHLHLFSGRMSRDEFHTASSNQVCPRCQSVSEPDDYVEMLIDLLGTADK
jgi:hypothetical protein